MRLRPGRSVPIWASLLLVASTVCISCGSNPDQDKPEASPTQSQDVLAEASVDRVLVVGPDGHHLALRCFGKGAPAIVFEVGTDSSGLNDASDDFLRPMAKQHMTCVYDRAGTGSSNPPKEKRRTIDDAVDDLHGLLTTAKIPGPYLLVGSSGGGNIVAQFALRYPDDMTGEVLIDVPAPNPHLDKEFPGPLAWKNPEHIDWVAAELSQSKIQGPVGEFPMLVITAADGDSDRKDQSFWLDMSPNARQIVMPGGHDLHAESPAAVAKQVLSMPGAH